MVRHHEIEITHTASDLRDVPDAYHVTCSCGWAAAVHDRPLADVLAGEHLASPDLPAPASPTPTRT